MAILHVIDALDGCGSARQLELLAPALAQAGTAVEVCCLGPASRQADVLRAAGIPVHVLGWTRWLDAPALWTLRGLLRGGDVQLMHVWRLAALRAIAVTAPERLGRAVFRSPIPAVARLRWWDRRVLERVGCVAAASEAERSRWQQHGLSAVRCRAVPSAVSVGTTADHGGAAGDPQRIACTGRLERGGGYREAAWAVDILRYVFPDVQLLIGGTGPGREDLQSMIDRLRIVHAHLLDDTVAITELLAVADVCWVPSCANVGRQSALEALAAGKAVVASDVPCLRELIRDGVTGCLVPPGDPVALARRTRALLQDPERRAELGAAARADMVERFAVQRVVAQWRALYNELAA